MVSEFLTIPTLAAKVHLKNKLVISSSYTFGIAVASLGGCATYGMVPVGFIPRLAALAYTLAPESESGIKTG